MKRGFYTLGFFIFIFFSLQVSAQSDPAFNDGQITRCGTYELHKIRLESDPQYRAYYDNIGEKMQQWSSQSMQQRATTPSTIVIPVVVHVIWNTGVQNISDVQVQSQIAVLNEDFSGMNSDQNQIPSAFKSVFGNAQINFCLASRKPNGDWTNGIERRQTSVTSFGFGDTRIKDGASGGLSAWDRTKYLNIWVCNLGGSILGYTEMPGSAASEDGTVILYSAFGNVGSLIAKYNKGRTATHEIGHWLGLMHTWGDDGGSCAGSDYISDTPNQSDATYGCPSYPRTDACAATAPGVMFMNYMDYTDDGCMHMFTAGQATVMRNILNSTRSSILSSNGCAAAVGFAEINAETFINLYPNPANEVVHIDFHLALATVISVTAYDMLGKQLITSDIHKTGDQSINLDVSALKSGLYTLVVSTDQGNIAKRFSVAH